MCFCHPLFFKTQFKIQTHQFKHKILSIIFLCRIIPSREKLIKQMKRRECKLGAPSTDLLVCFPTRARLSLMPKPICSPARPSDQPKRHRRKSFGRGVAGGGGGGGHAASPLMWAKSKQMGSDVSEPTSPKVTCAGQIKVRPRAARPGTCKNWQSVMEEIEKLHKQKKPSWVEALGIKKDAMQFLTCLRNIRFDFRCFGAFPTSHITSDDEDDDDEDEEEEDEDSRTVFSKWFMVLQEDQENQEKQENQENQEEEEYKHSAPPSNALLLMRCRSAPAKSWLEEKLEEEKLAKDHEDMMEEIENKKRLEMNNMVVMRYYEDNEFYKISSDIAKETWVVGGIKETLSKSRSWKS